MHRRWRLLVELIFVFYIVADVTKDYSDFKTSQQQTEDEL